MSQRLETPQEARARLERAELSGEERAELWRRVAESAEAAPRRSRRRALRAAGFALPVLGAAAIVTLLLSQRSAERSPSTVGIADPCALDAAASKITLPAHCRERALHIDGDEWRLSAGSEVARTPGGAAVQRGRVRFHVHKRERAAQFRVRVSHGEVRVVGTVFVVEQHARGGSVTVSEGVIEFVWQDGARERVAAGQSLSWPRVERPQPQSSPSPQPSEVGQAKAQHATDAGALTGGAPDLERVLQRLLQLQSQRRFDEASSLLKKTLGAPGLAPLQRERISYELGLALEASAQPSCPHWLRHVERFGSERHAAALAERIARCRK